MKAANLAPSKSTSANDYETDRTESLRIFRRAAEIAPSGVHHNLRSSRPFPLYFKKGAGAYKWDADGNQYLCYAMGQGSQLFGYSYPPVVEAIRRHSDFAVPGGSHVLEVQWAELVHRLIPSAEQVRFLASGTEATMLALRVARAATGRSRVLRIRGHYNGWHDYGMVEYRPPFDGVASAGVPSAVADTVGALSSAATGMEIREALSSQDIAAVILEPTGASWGTVPLREGFLQDLRAATTEHGTVLVFDEVITGFRYSPGGVQSQAGVTPDLTSLGKILSGGLPAGALAGRGALMDLLRPGRAPGETYVLHHGTFNGHPVVAAAGVAMLENVALTECQRADAHATAIRDGLNTILRERGVNGFAYGTGSVFHMHLEASSNTTGSLVGPETVSEDGYLSMSPNLIARLHRELRIRRLDPFSYNGGMASAAHGDKELSHALEAFAGAVDSLVASGLIATL